MTDVEDGRLVPPDNVESLSAAIKELLLDEDLRRKRGASACQTIMNRFALRAELERNPSVYQRLGRKL